MKKRKKTRVCRKSEPVKINPVQNKSAPEVKPGSAGVVISKKETDVIVQTARSFARDSVQKNEDIKKNASVSTKNVSSLEMAVVLSNLRVPNHDEKAIQLALMHIKDLGVAKIKVIFNGDIIDYFHRSDIDRNQLRIFTAREISAMHSEIEGSIRKQESEAQNKEDSVAEEEDRKPRKIKTLTNEQLERFIKKEVQEKAHRKELEQLFAIFKMFIEAIPNADIVWVYGCQEFYLLKYLEKQYPQLIGEIDNFCRQNKIQKVYNGTRNNTYNYGPLVIGHWFRGGLSSPSAFVAHTLLDDEGVSLIQGHTNRGGWACRTIEGTKYLSAYENFSLCKRPVGKNWQLGYSLVYKEKNKRRFQVFQIPIASYGFFWGDKEYRLDQTRVGVWEKAVAISDIHRPWEDKKAVDVALSFIKDFQPDVVFVNGDVNDFYDISRFTQSPIDILTDEDVENIKSLVLESSKENRMKFIKPRLQREFEKIHDFFKKLREICPKAEIIWVYGNHEFRLQGYVEQNAGHLAGVRRPGDKEEILSLAEITRVKELGVKVVYSGLIQSYTTYGGLLVGHFYRVNAKSAYTARNLLQQKHQSLIQPHVHRMGAHYKTDNNGKMLVAVEMGCLCRLDPQYMQNPNWQQGFVVIHKKKNSDRFYLQPVHIVDGAFLFGGKRFGRPSNGTNELSANNDIKVVKDKIKTPA